MTETISAAQYRQTKPKKLTKQKFNNTPCVVDGIRFASKKEGARYIVLRDQQIRGEISHLELQPRFKLFGRNGPVLIKSAGFPKGRQATYVADFAYFCPLRDKRVVEDTKGMRTPVFILKKAMCEENYPAVEIVEI